ncbi:MAG: hypothetical protein P9F75_01725 [Candidatus Contendobacter sp.]|nr:hypothetical protein [Candidatus Contendobacter sp.]
MKRAVVHRILRGFGSNLYGQAVVTVIQLAGVPILIHCWGVDLYGEWLILFAIPTYLSMTDLGFSQSAANDMTARAGRGDDAGALEVFQSLAVLVYLVACIGLLVVTIVCATLPLARWLHFSQMTITDIRWVLWLFAAEVLAKLPDGVNHAGFRSQGDYALHNSLYYSILLIQNGSVWLIALMGLGPVSAATAFFSVRVVATPSIALLLTHRHSCLTFGLQHARCDTLRRLVKPAFANISMPLALALNIQGMTLVVGSLLSPAAVVTFNTLRTLSRLTTSLVLSISNALEPELARAWGSNNPSLLNQIFIRGLGYGVWLSVGSASVLLVFGNSIMAAWTHGRVRMDVALFQLLLASGGVSVLWLHALGLLKATNSHLRAALWYAFASASAILLAWVLIKLTRRLSDVGFALLFLDILMLGYLLRSVSVLLDLSVPRILLEAADPRLLLNPLTAWSRHARR